MLSGCPQKWAVQSKIGGWLSSKPEIVKQMVTEARKCTKLPVSIKIRLGSDIKYELLTCSDHNIIQQFTVTKSLSDCAVDTLSTSYGKSSRPASVSDDEHVLC